MSDFPEAISVRREADSHRVELRQKDVETLLVDGAIELLGMMDVSGLRGEVEFKLDASGALVGATVVVR